MKTRRLSALPLLMLCAVGLIGVGREDGPEKEPDRAQREQNLGEIRSAAARVPSDQLILVREFSTENTEVEGRPLKFARRVAARKRHVPPLLTRVIYNQLLMQGYRAATFSSNESATGALVIDGEFVRMHSNQRWMTLRMWVYHTDDPSKRITQTEVTGKYIGGKASAAKANVPTKRLAKGKDSVAHIAVVHLLVHLPSIIAETH